MSRKVYIYCDECQKVVEKTSGARSKDGEWTCEKCKECKTGLKCCRSGGRSAAPKAHNWKQQAE